MIVVQSFINLNAACSEERSLVADRFPANYNPGQAGPDEYITVDGELTFVGDVCMSTTRYLHGFGIKIGSRQVLTCKVANRALERVYTPVSQ
jgi:hypothetical protein